MPDVVIIGAGMGGLSAAVWLLVAGLDVVVLEAGPQVGGKAAEVVVDGVGFDTGPSVLTMPEVFDELFEAAGGDFRRDVGLVHAAPSFRYRYPDGTVLDVHEQLDDTLASVERTLGGPAAEQLSRYLAQARRIWETASPTFVKGPAPTVGGMLSHGLSLPGMLWGIDGHRSLWRAITSSVDDWRLQWLLARYATYNGSDPRSCPATLGCIAWVELGLGGFGVRGGMHRLPEALADLVWTLGGTVQVSTPVRSILTGPDGVRGVRTDNEEIPARAVVANADVAHVLADLLPEAVRGLSVGERSTSGWTAVVRSRRRDRAAHTVVFPERYLDEFADLFDRKRPPAAPTVYACAQGTAHDRPGWGNDEPVFLMANAPAESTPTDDAVWRTLEGEVLARAASAGLVDADEDVVWTRTPTALATRFPRTGGAIYGASSNALLAAFKRPANRVRGLPGLYLASGSAHPGGGVPLCALSGRAAARAVLDDRAAVRAASSRM